MRQEYHLTLIAEVDRAGRISRWRLCEPGGEPVDSDRSVWDPSTESWQHGDEVVWARAEQAACDALIRPPHTPTSRHAHTAEAADADPITGDPLDLDAATDGAAPVPEWTLT